jgi:hypothetical protein
MGDVHLDRGLQAQDAEPCATGAELAASCRAARSGCCSRLPLRLLDLARMMRPTNGAPLVLVRLSAPYARLDAVVAKTVVNTAGW